jgi:hypothetical protein
MGQIDTPANFFAGSSSVGEIGWRFKHFSRTGSGVVRTCAAVSWSTRRVGQGHQDAVVGRRRTPAVDHRYCTWM